MNRGSDNHGQKGLQTKNATSQTRLGTYVLDGSALLQIGFAVTLDFASLAMSVVATSGQVAVDTLM